MVHNISNVFENLNRRLDITERKLKKITRKNRKRSYDSSESNESYEREYSRGRNRIDSYSSERSRSESKRYKAIEVDTILEIVEKEIEIKVEKEEIILIIFLKETISKQIQGKHPLN